MKTLRREEVWSSGMGVHKCRAHKKKQVIPGDRKDRDILEGRGRKKPREKEVRNALW